MASNPAPSIDRIVQSSLADPHDSEHERLLVAGAVVVRHGDHYSIAEGDGDPARLARLAAGQCDCGASLSVRDGRRHCRTCTREIFC